MSVKEIRTMFDLREAALATDADGHVDAFIGGEAVLCAEDAVMGFRVGEEILEAMRTDPELTFEEVGKRNSAADQARLQAAHDAICAAGAKCDGGKGKGKMDMEDPEEDTLEGGVEESLVEADPDATLEAVTIHESIGAADGQMVTLREAGAVFEDAPAGQAGGWVTITPIKPGFGNPKDGFYYPAKTLREAVDAGVFNGRKMFRDHPRRSDEKELPERSTDRWIGTVKEATWDEAKGRPRAKVRVYDQGAYQRFKDAPDEIAFSILGGGSARPGRVDGREARIVESLARIRSVDWVTEAGAGGALDFAEAASDEVDDMDLSKLTAEQLRDANPDLYDQIAGTAFQGPPDDGSWPDDGVTDDGGADDGESREALQARLDRLELQMREGPARDQARRIVVDALKATTLPAPARTAVLERFAESTVGDGFMYPDPMALGAAVDREIESVARLVAGIGAGRPSAVRGLDSAPDDLTTGLRESISDRLADRFGASGATAWTPDRQAASGEATPIAEASGGTDVQSRLASRL